MDRKKLAQVIRDARGDRSQGRFARDLGLSAGTIRNWELGDSEPSLDNLKAIADAAGMNLLQLIAEITGEESGASPKPRVAEDVMAIASKLDLSEQFRLVRLLVGQIAILSGVDLED
ncbi:MAG: helix-turn-helix domain-containing protein [Gloeotrichia echinulata GP01]